MLHPDRRVFRLLLLLLDLGALLGAFHAAAATRLALNPWYPYQMTWMTASLLLPPLGLILLLWIPMSQWLELYRPRRGGVLRGTVTQVVESVAAVAILTIVVTFFVRNFGSAFSRSFVLFFAAYSLATLLLARLALWGLVRLCQKNGGAVERVAVVGWGADALELIHRFESVRAPGLRLSGVITTYPGAGRDVFGNPVPVLGSLDEVGALINTHHLDRIVAVPTEIGRVGLQQLASVCARMGVTLNRSPLHAELQGARLKVCEIGDISLLEVRALEFTRGQELLKRAFDMIAGTALLLALSPLLLALAAAVKLTSSGPILYISRRVGKGGRHFAFLKFRSMVKGAESLRADLAAVNEQCGHLFKIKDDPRLTPLGRFMRRFSLDELPQILNVLKGDMSLVGPRPLPAGDMDQDGLSREHAFWASERTRLLPGITGLWQVRGRSDLGFEEMIRLDVEYARTWSLLRDVVILLETAPAVIRGRGAC